MLKLKNLPSITVTRACTDTKPVVVGDFEDQLRWFVFLHRVIEHLLCTKILS